MRCEHCNQNEATTYIKQNINGKVTEMHLCRDCAEKLGVLEPMHSNMGRGSMFEGSFFGNFLGAGLAAMNAILGVEYADRLFREQGVSLMDAAIGAAKLRVRPIIMTAFAFFVGVLPLVFASGGYATDRFILGVALVGGMLFATLLGIFVYPALYYFVGKIGRFEQRRELKKQEENA